MLVPGNYLSGHQTDRLQIRSLTVEHTASWIDFLKMEETTRFFPEQLRTQADSEGPAWIKRQQERYATGQFGLQALHLHDGTFIGQCGLLTQEAEGEQLLEIGYHLFPAYWGKGYATEAAIYFREFALHEQIAPFVVSMIHRDNTNSQAVAGRNGMNPWKSLEWRDMPIVIYRYSFQDK